MDAIERLDVSLDDLRLYAAVVRHGGYAAAARALGVPTSRLSRHVDALERHLDVRLLQRSTRRFRVTPIGERLARHAEAMLAEAGAALAVVAEATAAPRGRVRVACPIAIAESMLAPVLPSFLARYPDVRLDIEVSNRRVDVLAEGFDCALRVRQQPSGEDGLVMRRFAELEELLVASPAYCDAAGRPGDPEALAGHPFLGFGIDGELARLSLIGPGGGQARVELLPRVSCAGFAVLREAAIAGLGIALLPESVARPALADRRLLRVLPDWRLPQGVFHVVFPHRRGLLPAVRALIDFLAIEMPEVASGIVRSPPYGVSAEAAAASRT
jgi:DNA-binding transcriptional LysR family regulator